MDNRPGFDVTMAAVKGHAERTGGEDAARVIRRGALPCVWAIMAVIQAGEPADAQSTGADADPGQIERRIEERHSRPPRDSPDVLPLPAAPSETPGDDGQSFVLSAVALSGVTVFRAAEIAESYEEFLARTITLSDAEAIANRITRRYREAGYVLSRAYVPPQTVETGVLRVVVVEGHVGTVEMRGPGAEAAALAAYGAAIRAERPLTLTTLERNILLINDLAGVSVDRSNLEETEEGSGDFTLTLTLGYDRVDGTAYLDNRGTPAVGRPQSWTAAGANSVFGKGERLQLGLFTVPTQPRELIYLEGEYRQPLGTDGTEAAISLSHSAIDAGSDLGELDTESESVRLAVRVSHPLVRSRDENLWLNGLFEARNSREERQGSENFDDRLRVARIRVNYVVGDEEASSSAIVMVSRGLGILGASNERSGPLSRFDGRAEFTKVNADLVHTRTIAGDWSAQIAAIGQKSADSLLSSEEFGLGGNRFGRAYDFGEVTGEDGIAGSAELRYTLPDPGDFLTFAQLYGFYDIGAVWNRNATGTFWRHSLSSAGIGLRVDLPRSIRAGVEAALPLTRQVETSGGDTSPRYFFTLAADF